LSAAALLHPLNSAASVGGFCGKSAGGGAEDEPLGGAANATPSTAASRNMDRSVAFSRERDGFRVFVSEVVLHNGEPGLAGFAVDGEVVERL